MVGEGYAPRMIRPEVRRAVYFGKPKVPTTVPNVDEVVISDGIIRLEREEDGTITKTELPIDVANSGRNGSGENGDEK